MAITLEKYTKEVNLVKQELHMEAQEAEVYAVVDISASMDGNFRNGTVQDIVLRSVAVGLGFDTNKQIDVVLFGEKAHYAGTVTKETAEDFAKNIYNKYPLEGSTRYATAINMIKERALTERSKSLAGLLFGSKAKITTLDKPIYVLFYTDGDNQDKSQTTTLIDELSRQGIFFQFVGIGGGSFDYLVRLDDMPRRGLDNVDFFDAYDIRNASDHQIFLKMMNEFSKWVPAARSAGYIK